MLLLKRIIEDCNLYEGLEVTHNAGKAVTTLLTWWNLDGKVWFESDDDNNDIKMTIRGSIEKEDLDNILKWINNYGYFPSTMIISWVSRKYNYEDLVSILNQDKLLVTVIFDPKYDPEIAEKNLPDKGYHIAPTKNEEKILKIGLSPRSKERLTKHPDRIYFTADIRDAYDLLSNKKFRDTNIEFTIFEFDLKELKNKIVIRYFKDPRYLNRGFYTYENIPPQYLTVVKRISPEKI